MVRDVAFSQLFSMCGSYLSMEPIGLWKYSTRVVIIDWNLAGGGGAVTSETEVPMLTEYFILSLMRLDRDHYQRIEAVRNVTGDDMAYFLFAPSGELESLILDYLGFPADGAPIKGGGKFTRNAWDWEYQEMLVGGLPATEVLMRMKKEVDEANSMLDSEQ